MPNAHKFHINKSHKLMFYLEILNTTQCLILRALMLTEFHKRLKYKLISLFQSQNVN